MSVNLYLSVVQAMAREHKGKLALDSLLIMPVQRIPRYELLIQVEHTCIIKNIFFLCTEMFIGTDHINTFKIVKAYRVKNFYYQ